MRIAGCRLEAGGTFRLERTGHVVWVESIDRHGALVVVLPEQRADVSDKDYALVPGSPKAVKISPYGDAVPAEPSPTNRAFIADLARLRASKETVMPKRLCTSCGTTPLHHDNTSGLCKACKAAKKDLEKAALGQIAAQGGAQTAEQQALVEGRRTLKEIVNDEVVVTELPTDFAKAVAPARVKPAKKAARSSGVYSVVKDMEPKERGGKLTKASIVFLAVKEMGRATVVQAQARAARHKDWESEPDVDELRNVAWYCWDLKKKGYLKEAE